MASDFVRIGLNGPRISRGASGFISHRSMWLGPPRLKIMMHAAFSLPDFTRPASLAARTCGSERPMAASAPTWRNSRRLKPEPQRRTRSCGDSARRSNMAGFCQRFGGPAMGHFREGLGLAGNGEEENLLTGPGENRERLPRFP